MSKISTQFKESRNLLISPPISTPLPSFPSPITNKNSISSSSNKISPVLILIIITLAIIFFVAGILHLLIRYLMKRPSFYASNSLSNSRNPENISNHSSSETLQRQLQQLFRLHDSGLDQPLIDALPVFYYKDIMGLKEPFDCAVCLCEFCDQDKLRLLPLCSHAFHISCIDTWLLSNSTCPLCRGSLLGSGLENQEFSLDHWRNLSFGRSIDCENNFQIGQSFNNNKPTIMEESASERRVFSVRLGKFRGVNDRGETTSEGLSEGGSGVCGGGGDSGGGSQLDGRRCYSLGSYQYVVVDSNLQVELSTNVDDCTGDNGGGSDRKREKMVGQNGNALIEGDIEGKKISRRNKGESFSVSKIWLWSKKGKFQGPLETNVGVDGGPSSLNAVLPLSTNES